jgi:acylphosphatase
VLATPSGTQCWKLLVSGRVQGIGYRLAARHEARRLGLNGLARNLLDGSVEVTAEGAPAALAQLESWCRRGPLLADVSGVTVERLPDLPGFVDFDIG